jgi:hypothetical protein
LALFHEGVSVNYRTAALPVVLGALVLLSVPAIAGAQDDAANDPRTKARIHLGMLHLNPIFRLTDVGVDTNVLNSADAPQSDFTMTVAPALQTFVVGGGHFFIRGRVGGEATYYRKTATQRSLGGDVAQTVELRLHRLRLFTDADYASTRNRPTYEFDARIRNITTGYGAGIGFAIGQRVSFEGSAHHTDTAFDPDAVFDTVRLRETLNHAADTATGIIDLPLTPYTTVEFTGVATHEAFPFAPHRDNDQMQLTTSLLFNPRAAIAGTATLGYQTVEPYWAENLLPSYRGPVAHASLTYRFHEATQVTVAGDRDVQHSFELAQPYFINTTYDLSLRRHLFGRYDGTVGSRQVTYDYKTFLADIAEIVKRRDRISNHYAFVGTKLTRGLRLETGATYARRESNTLAYRYYSGWRFMTSIVSGF